MAAYGPDWALWVWITIVAASFVAAALAARGSRDHLSALTPHHVAAATVVGMLTWFLFLQVPDLVRTVLAVYAGIEGAPSQTVHQLFAATHVAVVVGGVAAVVGLLRRRAWAVALGAGVCLATIGDSLISLVNLAALAESGPPFADYLWLLVSTALRPIPAVVGLVLLAWPFAGGRSRPTPVAAAPDDAARAGWPDAGVPAEDGR